jgi:hypothetical protein
MKDGSTQIISSVTQMDKRMGVQKTIKEIERLSKAMQA